MTSPKFTNCALSALAGSLLSTIAVILAGHWPAILLILGFVTACALYTWVLRLLGVERYARWFYAGWAASDRLKKISGEVSSSINNSPAASQRQFSNRAGNSETSRPVRVRYGRDGRTRPVGNVSERERWKAATGERTPRRAPTYNQTIAVLRPVEQDVLSALMNLGCSFRQSEEAVRAVSDGGESFDELFRKALDSVNAGKGRSRKAVA